MIIKIHLVKSFTQNADQGNPAGVILNADNLSDQQMLSIAKHCNFSECVFVQKSDVADFKTRFFTPTQEVDYCGHATIAVFYLIARTENDNPKIVTQETKKGIFQITCSSNGLVVTEQADPTVIDYQVNNQDISDLLNIPMQAIIGEPQIISTGIPKLIIPIDSLGTLFKINPDFAGIKKYCQISGARGFYPFTAEVIDVDSDFHARQFNPLAGIDEDPITGIAAGALASYLVSHNLSNKKSFTIEQGAIMNRFGKMYVDVSDMIRVAGYAIEYGIEELLI